MKPQFATTRFPLVTVGNRLINVNYNIGIYLFAAGFHAMPATVGAGLSPVPPTALRLTDWRRHGNSQSLSYGAHARTSLGLCFRHTGTGGYSENANAKTEERECPFYRDGR